MTRRPRGLLATAALTVATVVAGSLTAGCSQSPPAYTPAAPVTSSGDPGLTRERAGDTLRRGLAAVTRVGLGRFQSSIVDGPLAVTEAGRFSLTAPRVFLGRHLDTGLGSSFDLQLVRTPDQTYLRLPGNVGLGGCWLTGDLAPFARAAAIDYDVAAGPYPSALLALGDAHADGFANYDPHVVRGTLDFERVLAQISPTAPAFFHVAHGDQTVAALFQVAGGRLTSYVVTARSLNAAARAAGLPRGRRTFAADASVRATFVLTPDRGPRRIPSGDNVLHLGRRGPTPAEARRDSCGVQRIGGFSQFLRRGGLPTARQIADDGRPRSTR